MTVILVMECSEDSKARMVVWLWAEIYRDWQFVGFEERLSLPWNHLGALISDHLIYKPYSKNQWRGVCVG